METNYTLEIYAPEGGVLETFDSDKPFGAISVGDAIKPMTTRAVRVTTIQHIIWEIEGSHVTHKICVFTEPWPAD